MALGNTFLGVFAFGQAGNFEQKLPYALILVGMVVMAIVGFKHLQSEKGSKGKAAAKKAEAHSPVPTRQQPKRGRSKSASKSSPVNSASTGSRRSTRSKTPSKKK